MGAQAPVSDVSFGALALLSDAFTGLNQLRAAVNAIHARLRSSNTVQS